MESVTKLCRKSIGVEEGRSELIEILISEFIATKPVIQKN